MTMTSQLFIRLREKTPGLPGDECAMSSASARCRSGEDVRKTLASAKQGTAGMPAGFHLIAHLPYAGINAGYH